MAKLDLTEQQQAFVDALFEEGEDFGKVRPAMRKVGYPESSAPSYVLRATHEAIVERAKIHLAANLPTAVQALIDLITDGYKTGGAVSRINAIEKLMDRAGLIKKDTVKVENEGGNAILILPAKIYHEPEQSPTSDDQSE